MPSLTSLMILLPHLLNVVKYYGENGDPKEDMTWEIEILKTVFHNNQQSKCVFFFFL